MILLTFLLFIIGACFGSFIGVIADRLPRGENIFLGHSHCDSCKRRIKPYDLIPIVSYLLLRGRCRYCHKKIPLRVLLTEIASGTFFVLLFVTAFINWIVYALLCAVFLIVLAITFIDMDHGVIPDSLLIALGIVSLVIVLGSPGAVFPHVISGLVAFAFFLVIFLATRGRGIGFGDVKYSFFIGFLLSPIGLVIAFYTAFLTGAVISIILIVQGRKKFKGGSIAFGPFLSLGIVVALLFENQILQLISPFLGI